MKALYLESSAVLAWLLGEPRAVEFARRVNRADVILTSTLTLLEVERALIRAEREEVIKAADGRRIRGIMARAAAGWTLMELSDAVRAGAARTFPAESVRTLDALHLSTALLFLQAFPELEVLTFDQRLASNATALGLR